VGCLEGWGGVICLIEGWCWPGVRPKGCRSHG
jgi:hypothetical protein